MKATSWSVLAAIAGIFTWCACLAPAVRAGEKAAAPAASDAKPAAPGARAAASEARPAAAAVEAKAPAPAAAAPAPPASMKTGIACIDKWEDFIDATKAPFPWLTWGGDIRFRNDYIGNQTLNENAVNRGTHGKYVDYQRIRLRWWTTVTPVKDIDLNVRFESEPRHFSAPEGTPTWNEEQAWIDTMNIKMTNVGGSPLSMTLGRQEILPGTPAGLGDGWLVGDGTPIDGSRTNFFDAARFTYDFKQINAVADLIYINQNHEGNSLGNPLPDFHQNVTEQDEQGLILWATNRSVKSTEINGYYIYKGEKQVPGVANSDRGYIHTFGGRMKGDLSDHWQCRVEGAYQFGEKNDRRLRAFGMNSQLAYNFRDRLKNQLRLFYEYESGDDPHSAGTDEGFDPLWGRWPRWTYLYTPFAVPGTGEGVIREFTNLHRFGPGWTFSPTDRIECVLDYNFLFAATDAMAHACPRGTRPAAFGTGSFRGQLITFWVTATLTRHLKARLINEVFFPGNFYSDTRDQAACFVRGELYFTW